jgi:hypothetical protein
VYAVNIVGKNVLVTHARTHARTHPRAHTHHRWYQELAEYKKTHGDCNVAINWLPNPHLGAWVNRHFYFYFYFYLNLFFLSDGM